MTQIYKQAKFLALVVICCTSVSGCSVLLVSPNTAEKAVDKVVDTAKDVASKAVKIIKETTDEHPHCVIKDCAPGAEICKCMWNNCGGWCLRNIEQSGDNK